MQVDMERFHDVFFEEATEHLATLESELLELERSPSELGRLDSIFRAAHSIKGSSGTFGFPEVAAFTHHVESLLDRMREGAVATNPELIGLLLQATDKMSELITAAREGEGNGTETEALTAELAKVLGSPTPADPSPAAATGNGSATPGDATATPYEVRFRPAPDLIRRGMDPLLVLRELDELGDIESVDVDATRLPKLRDLDPDECYLGWTVRLRTDRPRSDLDDVFMFVEDGSEIEIKELATDVSPEDDTAGPMSKTPETTRGRSNGSESIRVPVDKVELLINLVGELVIANSMVNQAMDGLPAHQDPLLREAVENMDRTTRELQDQVMAVRMMPVGSVFRRFPRLVRDLAANLDKTVEMTLLGEDTEIDKQVIEEIGDPLTHLVRNAVDHGLETRQERLDAGKPESGEVTLKAYHEGGNVIIEVADDGRGLNTARIREKAMSLGLISAGDEVADEQIHALIFHAGFSTAASVSDVSGRGVGMDVVKRNVEALNGSIGIISHVGKGTTFRIKLPLTMAILDGLTVRLEDEVYIVPLLSVLESLRPMREQLVTISGRPELLSVRGETVPLIPMHRLFGHGIGEIDPCDGLVVIVEHQAQKFGLLIDEVLGQQQVVMKSLEENYEKVDGLSGATILGDGRVAFILDVPGLTRLVGFGH